MLICTFMSLNLQIQRKNSRLQGANGCFAGNIVIFLTSTAKGRREAARREEYRADCPCADALLRRAPAFETRAGRCPRPVRRQPRYSPARRHRRRKRARARPPCGAAPPNRPRREGGHRWPAAPRDAGRARSCHSAAERRRFARAKARRRRWRPPDRTPCRCGR